MKILEVSDIGAAIRSRRKELHYTQAYVSEFTGLSISFISDVENGKPTVEVEKVLQLLQVLGMDLFIENR
ncbi:MAG: helix-turn-helix transcriptional regulator [Clostridiales bacterium]|nr:helix-turn-helix transcriptional regulator [Clostridiales bacterium]MCD7883091.1 helix-turn-helix transcriptional regulator [Lachnospiraceae bacterium]